MKSLELRIPPPMITAMFALLMWGIWSIAPRLEVARPIRITVAVVLILVGAGFAVAGVAAFRRAETTINPLKPESTTALVDTGIYRHTRNPMYLGLLCVLLGWAALLAAPWTLLGPLGFVLFIDHFQIAPEERALIARFGDACRAYQSHVRRWL